MWSLKIALKQTCLALAYFAPGMFSVCYGSPDDAAPALAIESSGTKDIKSVRLIGRTTRYYHGVFGESVEATGLEVVTSNGVTLRYQASDYDVFEDREVRLADLDEDGHDEMIVVLTSLARGASLAIFALERGKIVLKARTPPLGAPHRWLNPAGIANFTGGSGQQVVIVRMPHAVGELQLWSYNEGKLEAKAKVDDVTNHRFGSRSRHLSAVGEFFSPGRSDLIIPSFDRRSVKIISFREGRMKTIPTIGEIVSDASVLREKFPAMIEWRLADGKIFRIEGG